MDLQILDLRVITRDHILNFKEYRFFVSEFSEGD